MKPISAIALIFATAIIGCAKKEHGEHVETDESEGVSFSAKSGLSVPKKTADFIGLQIVDVEERKVNATIQFSAQVYQVIKKEHKAVASALVSKTDAAFIATNQAFTANSSVGSLNGRVMEVNPASLSANGMAEVIVQFDNVGAALRMGEALSVLLPAGAERQIVAIPRDALLHTVEGYFVYTVNGEHLARTEVKVGAVNDDFAEITDGLLTGDQVAVKPVMTLWLAELQSLRGGKSCADGH